jgi:hypothetical protein
MWETTTSSTLVIRLFQGSEICAFFQGHNSLAVDSLDFSAISHQRFQVQGHILSVGGNALKSISSGDEYVIQHNKIG